MLLSIMKEVIDGLKIPRNFSFLNRILLTAAQDWIRQSDTAYVSGNIQNDKEKAPFKKLENKILCKIIECNAAQGVLVALKFLLREVNIHDKALVNFWGMLKSFFFK